MNQHVEHPALAAARARIAAASDKFHALQREALQLRSFIELGEIRKHDAEKALKEAAEQSGMCRDAIGQYDVVQTIRLELMDALGSKMVNMAKEAKRDQVNQLGHLAPKSRGSSTVNIERLAALPTLEYHQERKIAATHLNIGVAALDEIVKEKRREHNSDSRGQGQPLSLPEPEPWEVPVDGKELLPDLIAGLRRYVVMSDSEVIATALWIIHSHVFRASNITPRLAITSPEKGCGKTTLLDVLGVLVPRPLPCANAAAATFFRAIEMAQPTLLIDEADTFLSSNDELRGILNSGHRKGGSVLRCVGDDHEPRAFSTWTPAAIAMIGRLQDTLNDRSIGVRLRRRRRDESVARFRADRVADLRQLAEKIARWAKDNADALSAADPDMPAALSNRAEDNWRPLAAIADLIGGEWPDRVRRVAEAMAVVASADDQSTGGMLLADIKQIFREKDADRLSSEDLLDALLKLDDRSWSEWKNGKPMTKASLARQLGKFGIISEQVRFGTRTAKGYHLLRFDDAFSRYLPQKSETTKQANNDGHFLQNQNETQDPPVSLSKCEKPLQHSDCFVVSVCETPQGEENGIDGPVCAFCGKVGELLQVAVSGESVSLHRACIDPWEEGR